MGQSRCLLGGKSQRALEAHVQVNCRHQECNFVYFSKGMFQNAKLDVMVTCMGLAISTIFSLSLFFYLLSCSFSHKMFPVLNTGLENLGESN